MRSPTFLRWTLPYPFAMSERRTAWVGFLSSHMRDNITDVSAPDRVLTAVW